MSWSCAILLLQLRILRLHYTSAKQRHLGFTNCTRKFPYHRENIFVLLRHLACLARHHLANRGRLSLDVEVHQLLITKHMSESPSSFTDSINEYTFIRPVLLLCSRNGVMRLAQHEIGNEPRDELVHELWPDFMISATRGTNLKVKLDQRKFLNINVASLRIEEVEHDPQPGSFQTPHACRKWHAGW